MAKIVPTILAVTPGEYHDRLEKIKSHTDRVHVDISDGVLAPNKTINLAQVYVPDGMELDIHLMVKNPKDYIESALALKPNLIILHSEVEGGVDIQGCIDEIKSFGVEVGIAYLQESKPNSLLLHADHALIFTGKLGHYGGVLDGEQLPKIEEARGINPDLEISVDGGVNAENLADLDADIAYVGSAYLAMVGE